MAGIDGLNAGDAVTAEQMRALFGAGMHPLAAQRLEQLGAADLTDANIEAATRLGAPFKVYAGEVSPFRVEVAKRIATPQAAAGQLGDDPVSAALRARVRTEVAREFFRAEHGRDPIDAREIAATIAKQSRPRTQTVAGYDLTFSPVKSVSTLWAVADPHVAAQIELAHQAAVQDALTFIERHALFTRQGTQRGPAGQRHAGWSRPRSPTATPEPATRICTPTSPSRTRCKPSTGGGCPSTAGCCSKRRWPRRRPTTPPWSTISATGSGCGSRTGPTPIRGKRPVREIVGVDPALNQRWSTRRVLIKDRQGELAARFQRDHGRPPTPVEALQLAQQATLETRDAKHEPRTLAEQRAAWHAQAAETLGGPEAVQAMISTALNPISSRARTWTRSGWRRPRRGCWRRWRSGVRPGRAGMSAPKHNARSGPPTFATDKVDQLVDLLVDRGAADPIGVLTRPDDGISEPAALRRADGSSVYTVAGSELFTSARILAAEQRLVATAGRTDGRVAGRRHGGAGAAGISRQRERLGCRTGRSGSFHVHLRGAAAAGDRPRRRREDHRHAHPGSGVGRQRRPRDRAGPVRRRSGAAPRRHRRTGRNPGQAHLVHPPRTTCPTGRNASAGPRW